ncbi:hypothetical protein L873DRAFT_1798735 [Choiromyces venosus 120613-1]|uniref:Uncharacterized protein n=1 Tax=Choiromyces venosus 120613-1 TaxID=1336337 RepID=A0A3N4K2U7_9PEZI|nr:hypothetical protein L873DRAFT_1798735 [Choiromyces venosus 120613-1]
MLLAKKTSQIPLTEKYTIEKVKHLMIIALTLTPYKTVKKNAKNKLKQEIKTE